MCLGKGLEHLAAQEVPWVQPLTQGQHPRHHAPLNCILIMECKGRSFCGAPTAESLTAAARCVSAQNVEVFPTLCPGHPSPSLARTGAALTWASPPPRFSGILSINNVT